MDSRPHTRACLPKQSGAGAAFLLSQAWVVSVSKPFEITFPNFKVAETSSLSIFASNNIVPLGTYLPRSRDKEDLVTLLRLGPESSGTYLPRSPEKMKI